MKNKKLLYKNITLLLLVIIVAMVPLFLFQGTHFEGSDDKAEAVIRQINPEYTPWFNSVFTPANGTVELLLFMFQAIIGLVVIIYYFWSVVIKRRDVSKVS